MAEGSDERRGCDLRTPHNVLDRAVEPLYGLKAGSTKAQRLGVLLAQYQQLVPTLESQTKPAKARRKGASAQASPSSRLRRAGPVPGKMLPVYERSSSPSGTTWPRMA